MFRNAPLLVFTVDKRAVFFKVIQRNGMIRDSVFFCIPIRNSSAAAVFSITFGGGLGGFFRYLRGITVNLGSGSLADVGVNGSICRIAFLLRSCGYICRIASR